MEDTSVNNYDWDVQNIAENMERKAIMAAVTPNANNNPQTYKAFMGALSVSANFHDGNATTTWTQNGQEITRDTALSMIQKHVMSRLR